MSKNIRKFASQAEYDAYKANDGWDYPSVSFVETDIDSQVHYNNEFIMRWNTADTSKTPSFYGEISHDEFKDWVDHASRPCRISKDDHTQEEVYSVDSNGSITDWSQYDKTSTNHLHMTRIQNVNVGCFQDTSKGIKEVRFNFDKGCPSGFHKWFPHATAADGSKLWGRYDITPADTTISASIASDGHGLNVVSGASLSASTNGTWSANSILSAAKKSGVLAMTYWEHYVLTMIFSAYHKTFNHQSVFNGITSGSQTAAEAWVNGTTDSLLTHEGEVSSGSGYRFMHLENPIHGLRWIWGAGWLGKLTESGGQYYMTFDDEKANIKADMASSNADYTSELIIPAGSTDITVTDGTVSGSLPWGKTQGVYITDIDIYGNPCSIYVDGGSDYTKGAGGSSSGFYDGLWSYNPDGSWNRVAYLGGGSTNGDFCGGFARRFNDAASLTDWTRRGRVTMNA